MKMNIIRIFIFTLIPLFLASCSSSVENAATAQTADAPVRQPETNIKVPQPDTKKRLSENSGRVFFKTFIVGNAYQDDSDKAANVEHLIELKDNSNGISVYADDEKKAELKLETNLTKVSADFRESSGVRYFVLIVASAASGTCGDSGFAIIEIDENLNAKISKPNENACQGELYPVGIESVSREKEFYRQISIGDLKFNLKSFVWIKGKSKKSL